MSEHAFSILFSAWLMLLVAMIAPGPNLVACASAALGSGRRIGLVVASGIATGSLFWALSSSFGLAIVFTLFPPMMVVLRIGGGLYLLYLGLRALRAAWSGMPGAIDADRRDLAPLAAYRRGLTVCLLNPKSALFWASISSFVLSSGGSALVIFEFCVVAALSSFMVYASYVWMFSSRIAKNIYARMTRWFEAAFGVFFCAVGGQLILSR